MTLIIIACTDADIDPEGNLIDPVRVEWSSGGIFTTPPGWWHSHHNDTDRDAWVLPIQVGAVSSPVPQERAIALHSAGWPRSWVVLDASVPSTEVCLV